MLPSLVAHAVGYKTVVDAHNTVYVQMHVAGSTVFAWMANVGAYNTVCVLTRL